MGNKKRDLGFIPLCNYKGFSKEMEEKQRMIEIQEIYKKINGKICRFWNIVGEDNWRVEIVPLTDIPYIKVRKFFR